MSIMKDEIRYESKCPVVIVTGASSGLGAAFVRLLDESLPPEIALWLIARNEEKLCQFADGLQHEAQCFALDLTDVGSFSVISDALRSSDGTVQLLINNAGEGAPGSFEKQTSRYQESLCDLNVRAQVSLTSIVLPYMEEGSAIIFTSSVAAFLPQPGFATYAASKAFILSFGRALAEELRPRQIGVTVTCPNPMLTDFFTPEEKEKLLRSYKRFAIEDPSYVAEKTIAAVRKRKVVVVTSFLGKLVRLLSKILPHRWIIRLIGSA
jgi:short-subunit dehydrogenase